MYPHTFNKACNSRDDVADSCFELEVRDDYQVARKAFLLLVAKSRKLYLQRLADAAEPGSRVCIHGRDVCGPYDCYCGACESGEANDFGIYYWEIKGKVRQYMRGLRALKDAMELLSNAGLTDQMDSKAAVVKLQTRADLEELTFARQLRLWREELRGTYTEEHHAKLQRANGDLTADEYRDVVSHIRAERFAAQYKIDNPGWHPGF